MSTQTVDRFASIDDTAFDVYEIRNRLFVALNLIDPLLWIDLMNCDRLRGCPSYAAELLALDYARAIDRKRPQTAEVLAAFYHNEVRPFLNGYYLGMFDPQFPAQEVKVEPVKPTEEEVIASPEFTVYVDAAPAYDAATTIQELDRTTDALMASREALAVVCRQYVHLIHACEKECKKRVQATCLLCGRPITDEDRTVNGRTIHESCYLAQFEKPKPALDAAYWAEYARNNPAQQYAPSFGWANPNGN